MNDDYCYKLYMHVNKVNGKVYIGQTKQSYHARWDNGKGYAQCPRFATAIKKYGWDGFEHIPLIEGLTKSEADYFERFFIEFFDAQNTEFGYNLTAGGDVCLLDDPVVRAKHREAMKKCSNDPEWLKNVREANRRITQNPEWRKKNREANRKMHADPEYRKNHSEAMKKLHADPEWLKKLGKKVLCVETKIVYDSQKKAAIAVNLKSSSTISMCCRGEKATAGGYHWEYVDEELKNKYVPYASKYKRVLCVETGVIYLSVSCAASFVGVSKSGIYKCCLGKRKTCGGYHWESV